MTRHIITEMSFLGIRRGCATWKCWKCKTLVQFGNTRRRAWCKGNSEHIFEGINDFYKISKVKKE